jgi:hypothetical protein
VLQALPPGLDPLYDRMMSQIHVQDAETAQYCRDALEMMSLAFRPLQLEELAIAAGLPSGRFTGEEAMPDLVSRCGSFLTVRKGVVSFVHLSAKDYLTVRNGRRAFHGTTAHKHGRLTERLLDAMDSILQKKICDLQKPGMRTHEVLATGHMKNSSLSKVAYACEYWIEHLQASTHSYNASLTVNDWLHIFLLEYLLPLLVAMGLLEKTPTCNDILVENSKVHSFFQERLLHWLEAMSLLQKMPEAITALQKLDAILKVRCVLTVYRGRH